MEGGGQGRWTVRSDQVGGSRVYLGTSERVAGAVDSLVWGDKEFLNRCSTWQGVLQCSMTRPQLGPRATAAGGGDGRGMGRVLESY